MLEFSVSILSNLPVIWTFILLIIRYSGFFLMVPGIGMGVMGLPIRASAILVLACASLISGTYAELPDSVAMFVIVGAWECLFGALIGVIPLLVVSGILLAGQLSGSTMGLGASQLIDPTTGANEPTLGRIFGDVVIVTFLLLGGHRYAVYAVSGLSGKIVPGTFSLSIGTTEMLIERTGAIFEAGVMLAAPVIVALLLTQFVMGLISKAVPTVNIFIVSFPLTIGIGLIVSLLALPEMLVFIIRDFSFVERAIERILADAVWLTP